MNVNISFCLTMTVFLHGVSVSSQFEGNYLNGFIPNIDRSIWRNILSEGKSFLFTSEKNAKNIEKLKLSKTPQRENSPTDENLVLDTNYDENLGLDLDVNYQEPTSNSIDHDNANRLSNDHSMGDAESDLDGWPRWISCKLCEFCVKELQSLANDTTYYDKMVNKTIELCITHRMSDERICHMMVNQYKDEIHFVMVNLVLNPGEVCGVFLGRTCSSPFNPGHMWNVTLPDTPKPPPRPPTPPKVGAPTMRFLHMTDIHVDFQYVEGAPASCNEPLCCRDNVNGTTPAALKAGEFGSYDKCDIPKNLLNALFKHLADNQHQFDYVIFTGDIPGHDLWNQTEADQIAHIRELDRLFHVYLPFKPVYYTIGNHESSPCDSFPPPKLKDVKSMSWLYNTVADVWGRWLPIETDDMIRRCASYSFSPVAGFRIISLNNIYGSRLNLWLLVENEDPCDVLKFFIDELQKAEDAGEKVHVLTHIPPGIDYMMKAWSYNYYKIISRYENTIVNQFFGHSHKDYFEMFYDDVTFKRPVGVGFAAPSVTTYTRLNPTYRIYTMDGNYKGSSLSVLDYTNFYLNLTESNAKHHADWEYEYNPKKMYNMTSLYPADWDDLSKRMEKNNTLLQEFNRNYHALHPTEPCDAACRKMLLCLVRKGRSYDQQLFCRDLENDSNNV